MVDQQRNFLNLLPATYRRTLLTRKILTAWAVAWVAGLSAASFAYWYAQDQYLAALQQREQHHRLNEPALRMAENAKQMREQLKDFDAQIKSMRQLTDDRPTLTLLGVVGQAALASEGRLYVRDVQITSSSTNHHLQTLTLNGTALDPLSAVRFRAALHEAGIFRTVQLQSSTQKQLAGREIHEFRVECVF